MIRTTTALLVGLLLVAVSGGGDALAHARYDHSTPGQGAVVQTAPERVDIYTAQAMRKTTGANDISSLVRTAAKQITARRSSTTATASTFRSASSRTCRRAAIS